MVSSKDGNNIFSEYVSYLNKYVQKYGQKTVIMMQVGMFHEFYGVDNELEKIGNVKEISEILNIQMTRRDKKILENNRKNHLMAGFPSVAIDRYINILLNHQYTVVVVDQEVVYEDDKKQINRVVSKICSPGTYIDECSNAENNFLASIYLKVESNNLLTAGLCSVDLSTGEIYIHEAYSSIEDTNYALDETYRFIQSYNPSEIILYGDGFNGEKYTWNEIIESLDLHNYVYHIKEKVLKDYFKIGYQNKFLSKIYSNTTTGMLSIIEYLDLENKQLSTASLIFALQFAYDHNEKIIQKLKRPEIWNKDNYLVLANNAINQLALINNVKNDNRSVYTLIDKTSTPMGKRLLKYRLLNPITDVKILNNRYGQVRDMLLNMDQIHNHKDSDEKHKYIYQYYEKYLNNIVDIERLLRKIRLKTIQPSEFNALDNSYSQILELLSDIKATTNFEQLSKLVNDNDVTDFNKMISEYKSILDLEETSKYNLQTITDSFFKIGYNLELDEISYQIKHYNEFFRQLTANISNKIQKNTECVNLKYGDGYGYYLNLTNNRYNILKKNWTNELTITVDQTKYQINLEQFRKEKVSSKSTSCNLFSDKLSEISNKLIDLQNSIKVKTVELYMNFLEIFDQKWSQLLDKISNIIAQIDLSKSVAKTSIQYGYHCPEIISSPNTRSYLKAIKLRHPIIERVNKDILYVPHDISLNAEMQNNGQTYNLNGILVYGVNSCGKSSLMKSVGINLVLAQAGFFVPAKSFQYYPYKYVLTRIIGNDNIFKGMSSFQVEMAELRGILKRAGPDSLILGDEICHGTETISGISIVAAAIRYLSKKNSSFIFATHLHQLAEMNEITSLENVNNFHLRVKYEQESGKLIYDRNLMPGPGDPIYGLEVARAMQLDEEFLKDADKIRRKILDVDTEIYSTKKSHFNREVYVDKCQICSKQAEEVHHINFQCKADENHKIDHYHKNVKANLVAMCHNCHFKVHNPQKYTEKLDIRGYIQSTNGVELDYNLIPLIKTKPIIKPKKITKINKVK